MLVRCQVEQRFANLCDLAFELTGTLRRVGIWAGLL